MVKHRVPSRRRVWLVRTAPIALAALVLSMAADQQASSAAAPAPVSIYPAKTVPITAAEDDANAAAVITHAKQNKARIDRYKSELQECPTLRQVRASGQCRMLHSGDSRPATLEL